MGERQLSPGSLNLAFLEGLYEDFLRDPQSVPPDFRRLFEKLAQDGPEAIADSEKDRPDASKSEIRNPKSEIQFKQHAVDNLVNSYRTLGHLFARTNPLDRAKDEGKDEGRSAKDEGKASGIGHQVVHPSLAPSPQPLAPGLSAFGLGVSDMERTFLTDLGGATDAPAARPLGQIIQCLQNTYCGSIGVQFMHIDDPAVRRWLIQRMEQAENRCQLTRAEQVGVLSRLTDAIIFEQFIHSKFIGAKSFSLEGAETLIPLLDLAIDKAAEQGVDDIVLGMAHRGRLNVLANVVGKRPQDIFREFEDLDPEIYMHGGDVKYHLGYSGEWTTRGGKRVHLSLCFNPSHVEFINPVAMGRVRARQDRMGDAQRTNKLLLLIHGDAAFAAEGVVQESLNLSELAGYTVGGALHVMIDNQIGYTTSPAQGRSTVYPTDVARMLQTPIFQVNGEDPEAVAQAVRLALDFRLQFRRDAFISMICYRRHGHNESDEPRFTQPMLYRQIDRCKSVREAYVNRLQATGELTAAEAERIATDRRARLEKDLAQAVSKDYTPWWPDAQTSIWRPYLGGPDKAEYDVPTGVSRDRLAALLASLTRVPDGFHVHRTIQRGLDVRARMARGQRPLDWSAAEALALASLAGEGHRIRFTGQDSERGTFSQRHAVLHDMETGQTYMPLAHLDEPGVASQAPVEIINSPLSELAVLGFEYGYSLDCPAGLVMWEAQFGDFANAAQVIIDQFIASAQDKWCRLSGLVLLLPHGLEGLGPEHSSARLERFLGLTADDNIQVLNLTTPAQYFHCLRRQVLRRWRKPLVIMTPKSLLRHPRAVSALDDCAAGQFQRVIPDAALDATAAKAVRRVILCAGKLYYELAERRARLGLANVAIVRVEQLYPLATDWLRAALADYPDGTPAWWVQEEPVNMGAWSFMWTQFGPRLLDRFPLTVVAPAAMTTPASGSARSHKIAQDRLLDQAFEGV